MNCHARDFRAIVGTHHPLSCRAPPPPSPAPSHRCSALQLERQPRSSPAAHIVHHQPGVGAAGSVLATPPPPSPCAPFHGFCCGLFFVADSDSRQSLHHCLPSHTLTPPFVCGNKYSWASKKTLETRIPHRLKHLCTTVSQHTHMCCAGPECVRSACSQHGAARNQNPRLCDENTRLL